MGLLEDLEAAAAEDRPGIKAAAIAATPGLDGYVFTRGALTVTVLEPHMTGTALTFTLLIERNKRDLTPVDLNPITIVNPPILVPDAQGDVVIGEDTFRVDPLQSLIDAVQDLMRTRGL